MNHSAQRVVHLVISIICVGTLYAYILLPTSAARRSLFATQDGSDLSLFLIGAQAALFITAIISFFLTAFAHNIPRMRWLTCLGIIVGPIAIGIFTNLSASPGNVFSLILGIVYGAGQVALIVSWCMVLSRFGTPRDLFILSAALPVAELISWAAMSTEGVGSTWILIATAAVAGIPMLIMQIRNTIQNKERNRYVPGPAEARSVAKMVAAGPTLGLALFVLISSSVNVPFGITGGITVLLVLLGALLIALFGFFGRHTNIPYLFTQTILPIVAVLLLIFRILPAVLGVSSTLYQDGNVVFFTIAEALSMYFIVHCLQTSEHRPTLIIFAFIGMLSCAALIGIALQPVPDEIRDTVIDAMTIVFLIYIIVWFIVKAVRSRVSLSSIYHRIDINEFGREHGLSEREIDVLELYGRGYSAPYIASKLFISVNTVRNHIHGIYVKFGVNSHDELLELLDKTEQISSETTADNDSQEL